MTLTAVRLQLYFILDQPDAIMVPTKAQKTVKSTETDDDGGITFKKKQDDLRKSVVIRQEKARTRIRKNRSNKQKDLQKRIESLKRNITVEQ
ncbi:hypothetical protein D6D27_06891 [Aureobasidium pullulans]|uniref:Uncharacterized protein n=1 Tax=Aureobasidium pullulans TaxID=5580 RepID=A0A4S9DR47_AURPU|nr:hypothetical protein D6D27_06891 [Aureobasidium pullulans]THX23595.1 hypothetical protein D6D10_10289 [Aureobasidium pullulans]